LPASAQALLISPCAGRQKKCSTHKEKIMSNNTITLTGVVATEPRHLITADGLTISSFRLASTRRRFDSTEQKWTDGDTDWFTVTAYRQLATNSAESINKGDRILVRGAVRVREWESGETKGTTVEVEADALGHDLMWGQRS
jgi:single-strand DNA-binding protein